MPGTQRSSAFCLFICVWEHREYSHLRRPQQSRRRELTGLQRLLAHPNPQASASSLFSAVCLPETCSTRTCEIRGMPEILASDPASPPTRMGAFIAKNAAETIKKLWMYRCFTAFSFNCVHRCVKKSCTFVLFLPVKRHECALIAGLNALDASGSPMTSKFGRFYTS
jgi:hypothetical protein